MTASAAGHRTNGRRAHVTGGWTVKSIEIDRSKRLKDQPSTGHNRFHPDIPPIIVVEEGEEVVLATRDGVDGQRGPAPGGGRGRLPPRENGGNFDVKQLTKGSKLLLPIAVEGGLFSTGDGHFAQGDGEVCVTAVEMGATVAVRFRALKGATASRAMRAPRFSHAGYFAPPEWAAPRGFVAAMGMPIRDDGANDGENLTLACRNALLNMIDILQERGWSPEQAYIICSVAAHLRVSNVVDVPNYVVSAILPEAIFAG